MLIALLIAVPGIALLLLAAVAGLVAAYGRSSDETLVAPRNAGFGEARQQARCATRARDQPRTAQPKTPGPSRVLVKDGAPDRPTRLAA
jgi:hypothetical protein